MDKGVNKLAAKVNLLKKGLISQFTFTTKNDYLARVGIIFYVTSIICFLIVLRTHAYSPSGGKAALLRNVIISFLIFFVSVGVIITIILSLLLKYKISLVDINPEKIIINHCKPPVGYFPNNIDKIRLCIKESQELYLKDIDYISCLKKENIQEIIIHPLNNKEETRLLLDGKNLEFAGILEELDVNMNYL